ncbi:flagellar motor protein MotB [Flavobacterium sp. 28YEA47A]|uniref:hypothetical protein n=1 Tax=Flavobacterium sp. 28YEA47A TaxID=3156276 RepID=UPI003511898B
MKKSNAMGRMGMAHGETKLGVQNGMRLLLALFMVLSAMSVSAQKNAVLDAFAKHGIDTGVLNPENLQLPKNYAYELQQTTITSASQKVIRAQFDPSLPKEEQWTVLTVDGKSASRSDTNSFRKNQKKEQPAAQTDDATYRIEKETPGQLVISYKQNPNPSDKDAAFMKDCRMYMTINLKTKKVEQVQAINEKPLKIKMLNAEKFDLTIKYSWNEQAKRYFTTTENLDMMAKFLGQATPVQTLSEYSNYNKR